jgi:SP family galactose:H+ symporter-like MFS transporter
VFHALYIVFDKVISIMATSNSSAAQNGFVRVVVVVAALGGLLFGYDTGVISGAILFIKSDFNLSSTMQELVVSAVLIGAVIGAAIGGNLADTRGRRKMIIASAIIFTLGAIGTSLTPSVSFLIAGRIVVGVAIGIASFIAPMYISELAPAKVRGSLVAVNQLAVTIGIVAAYLIDFGFSGIEGWRYMFGLAAIPSLILGIAMWRLPDSPRWLISRDRAGEAKGVLKRIRPASQVDSEVKDIQAGLDKQTGGIAQLFHPLLRMAFIVGIGLAIFQQLTGINTVIYYAPTIFEFAGFKTAGFSILATASVGAVNVGFTVLALRLMDRVGRRPLLLIGIAGQVFALIVLGIAFYLHQLASIVAYVAIGSLAVYVASFAIGLGPVFWLMISEIYPLKVRGSAMSIATVANWGFNLIVALTFLTLVGALGRPETFWLYAVIGVAAWVFIFRLVPETKGKTLEEIEAHWTAGKHPREMG